MLLDRKLFAVNSRSVIVHWLHIFQSYSFCALPKQPDELEGPAAVFFSCDLVRSTLDHRYMKILIDWIIEPEFLHISHVAHRLLTKELESWFEDRH
jgi:hypothetical protein